MLSLLELELFVSSLLIALTSAGSYPHKAHRDVIHCLTAKGVPYADQSSANWTALSTPFNLRLIYEPAVITIPETPGQVSKSIICAAAAGLKVQAKGGGHSYASFSSGGKNGSMIIDMENFGSIAVDQSTFLTHVNHKVELADQKSHVHC
jgi:FAD/FMN-containing dehydrogenase